MESIVGIGGRSSRNWRCLRVIVRPGLGIGCSGWCRGQSGLSLSGILWYRHVNPLLGDGRRLVAIIPVALGNCIGSLIGDLNICDSVRSAFNLIVNRRRCVTGINLGSGGMSDSRVCTGLMSRSLCLRRLVILCEVLYLSICSSGVLVLC